MCYYISLILPADADEGAVRHLAISSGRGFEQIENEHLSQQLHTGERQFITCGGVCDCGTPIGSAHRGLDLESHTDQIAKKVEQFKSKGWSQSKIDRWLLQQQIVRDREDRINRDRVRDGVEGFRPDLDDWIGFLRQVVTCGASPNVGLLLHSYRGKLTTERITVRGRKAIRLNDLTPDVLINVAEDFIYTFSDSQTPRQSR